MTNEDVNPLKEDGTAKSQAEIEHEVALGNAGSAPGSRTDPTLLLKSLQEERQKRQDLEAELELLKKSPASTEVLTEEGKILAKQIQESNEKINLLTKENVLKDVFAEHPILKEKKEDFDKFVADPENAGMNIKTAAKAFLVENGLLDARRKGLETTTGGDRVAPSAKMTPAEIKTLRETDFKKYQMLLEKGLIEV